MAEVAEVMLAKSKLQSYVRCRRNPGRWRIRRVDQSKATMERTRLYADTMAAPLRLRWTIVSTAAVDTVARAVTVSLAAHRASFFGSLLPPGGCTLAARRPPLSARHASRSACWARAGQPGQRDRTASSKLQPRIAWFRANANMTVTRRSHPLRPGKREPPDVHRGRSSPLPLRTRPRSQTRSQASRSLCRCYAARPSSLSGAVRPISTRRPLRGISLLGNANIVLEPGEHYFVGPEP